MNAYSDGRYDDLAKLWFIYPIQEASIDVSLQALFVGRAGADGIEFCFRTGRSGVWAYYPIEAEWRQVARSLAELEDGWLDGRITV